MSATEHDRDAVLRKLIDIQYVRNDIVLGRGRFRVKGDVMEIQPANSETAYRISFFGDEVEQITHFDPLTGEVLREARQPRDLAGDASTSPRSRRSSARSSEIRARARGAGAALRGGGQAAGGAPDPAAHRVRPRDDAGARLLQRDRELLAHPRGPRAGHRTRSRCSTTSRRTSSCSSTSRTRPSPRSAACTRATARASRRSSTSASGCRRRSTTGRSASTSSSRKVPQLVFVSATPGPFELRQLDARRPSS